MIGLKRHTVELSPYQKDWLRLGQDACRQVKDACGSLPVIVEHVGSTSVPGLVAKPILDLALGLPDKALIHEVVPVLTAAGFIYRGEGEGSNGFLFVWEPEPDIRTIHVHAVRYPSPHWDDYVIFRDTLRSNADIRRSYQKLKQTNARCFANDRKGYTAAKAEFVRGVIAQAGGMSSPA